MERGRKVGSKRALAPLCQQVQFFNRPALVTPLVHDGLLHTMLRALTEMLRDEVRPGVRPAVYMLGLYQSWSVFAPNPSTASVAVEADIHFADGDVVRHRFPHGDDLVGAYREYRWRKWERRVRLDRYDHLWRDAAEWLAARYEDDGTVERIVLIRRFSDTPEPGSDEERIWQSVEFYEYDVPEPSPDAEDDG